MRSVFRSASLLLLALLLPLLLLGGCAARSSLMSDAASTPPVAPPTADESLVYFLRPSGLGWAVQSTVFDVSAGADDAFVGVVSSGTRVAYRAKPGERMFMVVGESADFMKASLEGGKTYYALVAPRMGVWKARFSLKPVRRSELDGAEFGKWWKACTDAANTERSLKWAQENRADVQKKKAEYLPKWEAKPEADKAEATLLAGDGR